MARTKNGNLTGKAAQTEKDDLAREIATSGYQTFFDTKQRYSLAVTALAALDPDYQTWLDTNIGPNDRYRDMAAKVENRISEIINAATATDPRSDFERAMDEHDAEVNATHESARPY